MDPGQEQRVKRLHQLVTEMASVKEAIDGFVKRCHHDWGDPISDPIKTPHMAYSHLEPHGSDPIARYVQAGWDEKPRWKRVCKRCGHVEFTEKQKVTERKPDFG